LLEYLLQLVEEGGQVGDGILQTLSLSGLHHNFISLVSRSQGITSNNLPVVEYALREGLARSLRTEISSETERGIYGQVSLYHVQGGTNLLLFREDVTTTTIESGVNTTHGTLRALDLYQVDGLQEAGLSSQHGGIETLPGGRDDLTSTSVDGVSVEDHIVDVESDTTAIFVAKNTFLCCPGKGSDARILDFVQVLYTLSYVNKDVGTGVLIRTKAPNLTGISCVPVEFLSENTGTSLNFLSSFNLTLVNGFSEILFERLGSHVKTVVLVGGLGEASLVGDGRDGLTVRDDRVGGDDLHTRAVLLLQIVEADFQMQFTGTSNDVLTRLIERALYHRIGLGQTLQTFYELGEIVGVLGLDGNTHDRGHGELHDTDVVSLLAVGDGTRLQQVLIDTDQTNGVTARDVFNRFDVTSHHENGTLDVLDEQIGLLSGNIVRSHNADLGTSSDSTSEDTTEGVETALVAGGYHLGDVQHEGSIRVALTDGGGASIFHGSFIKILHTILLGNDRGRQVVDNHVKESLRGREPLPHDSLQQRLRVEILLVVGKLNSEGLNHLRILLLFSAHDGVEKLVDRLEDELDETTLDTTSGLLAPFAGLRVEVVVTPQVLEELSASLLFGILSGLTLLGSGLQLGSVHVGELVESETPLVETGTKGDGSLVGVDGDVTEELILVGGDDHVDGFNGSEESLVGIFRVQLEFQKGTVHLVYHENGLDTFTKGLSKYSLSLYTNTFDAIDDHEGTIGHTEGGSHFRREIDVPRRIDQVNQKSVSIGSDRELILGHFVVKRYTSRLDGDTSVLFILSSIRKSCFTSLCASDNSGSCNERVGQGGFTVVYVCDDAHITDVLLLVHDSTDLIDCKVYH